MTHDDPDSELIALNDASQLLPNRPHRATIWRWALQGIRHRGETIKLATIAVGGRRYTTKANIDRFLAACNGVTTDPSESEVSRGK